MSLANGVVYQTMMAATVRGPGNLQIMQAIDQDHHQSHLSCTTAKYVKLAVLVPRYSVFAFKF